MRGWWSAVGVCVALFLGGCAQVPPKQAFNAAAAAHVKKLTVVRPPNQDKYPAVVRHHAAAGFGLVGAVIVAAHQERMTGLLTEAMDPKAFRLQEQFGQSFDEALRQAGYEVDSLELAGTLPDEAVDAELDKQGRHPDAVVRVGVFGGYMATSNGTDYMPRMDVQVKAWDKRDRSVLYADHISYGLPVEYSEAVHLDSDARYRYADIDALTKDPAQARQGLLDGVAAITRQVVYDLTPR